MKNSIIILALLLLSLNSQAQNLIKNGDFSQEVTQKVINPSDATPGEWFILNNDEKGISTISYIHDENPKYDGCIQITNIEGKGSIPWYKALLGQRLKNAGIEKGIYRLSFEAKADKNEATVGVFIKQTIEKEGIDPATNKNYTTFFVRDAYDINDDKQIKQSGANYNRKVSDKWTKVYVDFNTGKVINNYYSKNAVKGLTVSESDESILNDCYVAIQCLKEGESVRIDNVKFERIK